MTLGITPLHPLFAAEISGVQTCEGVDDDAFHQIRDALDRYSVLVFRGQRFTDEGHIAFSRQFGPLETTVKGNPGRGGVFARQSNLDVETGGVIPPGDKRLVYLLAARRWHTDSSFKPVPSLCSLLAGHVVPPEGANTEFATARAAYAALPDAMKERIEGLFAEHDQIHTLDEIDKSLVTQEMRHEMPSVRQPLVRTNPANGERALYVGAHAASIVGWPHDAGRALLQELTEFATQRQFVYSHRWEAGDLIVWDNRAVLHRATPYDTARYKRLLQRATVAGNEHEYRQEVALWSRQPVL